MPTEIRFYHLQRQSVAQALPALLDKALSTGKKIMLRVNDKAEAQGLSDALWGSDKNSFIPHGLDKDGNEVLAVPPHILSGSKNPIDIPTSEIIKFTPSTNTITVSDKTLSMADCKHL